MNRETYDRKRIWTRALRMLLGVMGMLLAGALALPTTTGAGESTELKIGSLMDFSGSVEASRDRRRAFELEIGHVNDGGGVLGRPAVLEALANAERIEGNPYVIEDAKEGEYRRIRIYTIHPSRVVSASDSWRLRFTTLMSSNGQSSFEIGKRLHGD